MTAVARDILKPGVIVTGMALNREDYDASDELNADDVSESVIDLIHENVVVPELLSIKVAEQDIVGLYPAAREAIVSSEFQYGYLKYQYYVKLVYSEDIRAFDVVDLVIDDEPIVEAGALCDSGVDNDA